MNDILELKAIKESIMKVKSNLEYDINKEESLTLLNDTLTKLKYMTFDFSKDVRNKKIEELLSTRYEKYRNVSDILIDINGKNIDEVISQILVYI